MVGEQHSVPMARCAGCEETISYGDHWRGIISHPSRMRPVVTCVACGQPNVQRVASTVLHSITIVGTLVAIGALVHQHGVRGVPLFVVGFLMVELAWWTFVAHLEKSQDDG